MALGQFFTIDALIATTVLISLAAIIIGGGGAQPDTLSEQAIAEDLIRALSAITVERAASPTIDALRSNGTIIEQQLNRSLLEYTAELWATDNASLANTILAEVTSNVSFARYAAQVNAETLIDTIPIDPLRLSRSTRLISGINKSQPVRGYSARMQFSASSNRTTSTFAYFGGFVGQGTISIELEDLPSDLAADTIVSFSMNVAIAQNTSVSVNGVHCADFEATPAPKESQYLELYPCRALLNPGSNTITLGFDDIEQAFVGGGFVRVRYTTQEIAIPPYGEGTYRFPVIEGIINLYDSITIPGNLTSLEIHLEYDAILPANVTTTYYLRIGNTTVYNGTNVTSEAITLTDADLTMLDYGSLTGTVPIRMGLEGVNYSGFITIPRPSDTVLVTDTSGSMGACGDSAPPLMCFYGCTYRVWIFWFNTDKSCYVGSEAACTGDVCAGSPTCANTYDHTACRTRMDAAKEAAKEATDLILDTALARVGAVSFGSSVKSILGLTNDSAALDTHIDTYTASGGTCICCGIYRASDMYTNLSVNHSYMIVLSDGDSTHRCTGPGDYSGASASSAIANQATIDAGEYACTNNISVFTIAVGNDLSAGGINTLRQTACDESMFFEADDFSQLSSIYQNVTQEILSRTTYTSQIVHPGEGMASNLTNSTIRYTYDPIAEPYLINEVPITIQTPSFDNCFDTFLFGSNLRVVDAHITSYSDEHWTSLVGINDETVFNISVYGADYTLIGDPFIVGLPADRFQAGVNEIGVVTGSEPGNETGCSTNNSIVIAAAASVQPAVSIVTPTAAGCHWNVLQEDLNMYRISIPTTYNGTKECYYENATYDPTDAYDHAAYLLFEQLDVTGNGRIDIYLREQELSVEVAVTQDVPSLWGPAEYSVVVGR